MGQEGTEKAKEREEGNHTLLRKTYSFHAYNSFIRTCFLEKLLFSYVISFYRNKHQYYFSHKTTVIFSSQAIHYRMCKIMMLL